MVSGTPTQGLASPLDAWTLVNSRPAAWAGTSAWLARDASARTGVLRLMVRTHAGPDGGRSLLEGWQRLQRVDDARLARPLAAGTAVHEGKDVLYVVYPALDGALLQDLASQPGALLPGEVAGVVLQTVEALSAAHNVGVIHGDVGRDALWLLPGKRVALADFGCVSWAPGEPGPARRISSPELRRGGAGTFAGDVYAAALLGASFFCGGTALEAWLTAPDGPSPDTVRQALETAGMPADLARVLAGALHADPIARPTAATLAQQLRAFAAPVPEIAPAATEPPKSVQAWLGEKSDPRAALPPPVPVMTPGALPAVNTSLPPLAAPVAPVVDNRSAVTLPPPPGLFVTENTHEIEPEAVTATSESMIIKAPTESGLFAATESQIMSAVSVPGTPALPGGLDHGPVTVNFSVPLLSAAGGTDFPMVARWTERPGGKGRTAVERILPPGASGSPQSTGVRPGILAVGALSVGLFFGVGVGRLTAPAATPAAGGLRVESTLEADTEVRVEMDGRPVGKAPLDLQNVPAGPHVLVLKADGADPTLISVDVAPREVAVVKGAPDMLASRLYVTASRRNVLVAREAGDPVPLPADFDDLDPDTDVKLTFISGKETLTRTVHVPSGEITFHLEWAGGAQGTPAPPAPEAPQERPAPPPPPQGRAPDPPPPPTEPKAARPEKSAAELVAAGKRELVAGRFSESADLMRQALAQDASLSEAVKSLGIAYTRIGRNCDAMKSYKRYLDMAPNAADADRVKTIVKELEEKAQNCN